MLGAIAGDVLKPDLVEGLVRAAREMFDAAQRPERQTDIRRELETIEREQARLEAIAHGGRRRSITDWRSLFTGDVAQARQGFRQLLTTPILLTPFVERGRRGIRFEGRIGLAAVLGGEVVTKLASPTGTNGEWKSLDGWPRRTA